MARHNKDKSMTHQLNSEMLGVTSYLNSANSKSRKAQHKSKADGSVESKSESASVEPSKQSKATGNKTNKQSKSTKGSKDKSAANADYPWTALIGVNEVAKLNAIQQLFGCKSRTEALQLVFKHCRGLITKSRKIDYKVLCKIFIQKNRPKAKARYQKYFNKKK